MAQKLRIGAHVSAAGGPVTAVERAKAIGAQTIQIFGSSPRQWKFSLPSKEAALAFRKAAAAAGIRPVFLHAPYLINLASGSPLTRSSSVALLTGTLRIAGLLGAEGVIFHIGARSDTARPKAVAQVVRELKSILKNVPGRTALILENGAGGGGKLGSELGEIGKMLDAIASPRARFCFDTAHAFEAGIVRDYSPGEAAALAETIARTVGWKRVSAIHANDSRTKCASHHDQHENIGKGRIGETAFRNLLAEKRFRTVPWLLEVPGLDGKGPDKANVDILKRLAGMGSGSSIA